MIDTDKYALVIDDDGYFCEDKIADLLAEVERLHEGIEKLANSMEISANKGKNRMSWPTRLLWVDALKELIDPRVHVFWIGGEEE